MSTAPPATPPVALALYTVREALASDFAGTLQRVADLGYEVVEPFDVLARADDYADALGLAGLLAPSMHVSLVDGDVAAALAVAERLGVATLVEPMVDAARWTSRADIAATADRLNEAAGAAADRGLRVAYHNHWWEMAPVEGATGLELLADALDDEVVLELDLFWVAAGGQDPVALASRLGERVRLLHAKDGRGVAALAGDPADPEGFPFAELAAAQVAVGSGDLPIRDVVAAAAALEVVIVELDESPGDVLEVAGRSRAFLTVDPA